MISGRPRVANATAVGEVELLALDWSRLQRIARWYPRSAYPLFLNLSVIMGERLAQKSNPVGVEEGTGWLQQSRDQRGLQRPLRVPPITTGASVLPGAISDRA